MRIGVIGFGERARHIANGILRADPSFKLAAVADPDLDKVRRYLEPGGDTRLYRTSEEMLEQGGLDGVIIGTRCDLHVREALKVLPTGIPLFLEKPVATTFDDLMALKRGYERHPSPVVVSFPLRYTPLVEAVRRIVGSGRIGAVEHVQAVNNVPYGGVYYHNWYRDESITGGLFLQKATHDFDYITSIVGVKATEICAMTSKQIFKGSKPAGLMCRDCDERQTCPESTEARERRGDPSTGEYCCFAEDTGNEDSGSAIIRYETGMHAVYSQNFFARNGARARGARLIGYEGTIEFDFYQNQAVVHMHHKAETERIAPVYAHSEHFGGDAVLIENFIAVMRGEAESKSTLEDGLFSALMCLHARESAVARTFRRIAWPEESRTGGF